MWIGIWLAHGEYQIKRQGNCSETGFGSSLYQRDSTSYRLPAQVAFIGRTFVPLRLISELLGAKVSYEAATSKIIMTK